MTSNFRIGVSSCLLGNPVRYDGGHKHDRWITDILGQFFEYVPVCPEVECGLGIPREAMRLVGDPANPRLVTRKTGVDHTGRMQEWAGKKVQELEAENLCGFIFKSGSPSSGMERVKVYNPSGMPEKKGVGFFPRAFMARFPHLPVEEEGRLHDPRLRENFIERVFTMKRWREDVESSPSIRTLVDFHTRHKLLIMSHSYNHYRQMGTLVAHARNHDQETLFSGYLSLLQDALRLKATPAKHANVMQHAMGYFKKDLTADEKQELLEIFGHYREGNVPLIVPVTLLNHYVRKYGQEYLAQQRYLNPHPVELKLRNHA